MFATGAKKRHRTGTSHEQLEPICATRGDAVSTIVSRSKFELSDRELVVTRRYILPVQLLRRMQALADAKGRSLELEVLQWFEDYLDDHDGRDDEIVKEEIKKWVSASKWEIASWIMSHALDKYGEWEICLDEEEFEEQKRVFFHEDSSILQDCKVELDLAVACALEMDGIGARKHAFAAAKYWWTDTEDPWTGPEVTP